jgi:hypothetical protein
VRREWFRPKPAYARLVEVTVYLAPAETGQGMGRALYAHLLERVARAGAQPVLWPPIWAPMGLSPCPTRLQSRCMRPWALSKCEFYPRPGINSESSGIPCGWRNGFEVSCEKMRENERIQEAVCHKTGQNTTKQEKIRRPLQSAVNLRNLCWS